MKALLDEGLSPRLVSLLGDFVLVTTDRDFARLVDRVPNARVAIVQRCDYPTAVVADAIRRSAIRLAPMGEGERLLWILPLA